MMSLLVLLLWVVFVVAVLWKLHYWLTRQPVCNGDRQVATQIREILAHPEGIKYNLKGGSMPVLCGWYLRFLTWLTFTRLGRLLVVPWMLRSAGITILRSAFIPDSPTYYPNPPRLVATETNAKTNDKTFAELVDQQITSDNGEGFRFNGVADFVRVYRSGELTPTQVIEAVLSAIAHSDSCSPPLRAVVQSNREVVLAQAQASTQRWSQHKPLSLLDGVPVTIKEGFRVEPYEFRAGATFVPKTCTGVPECLAVRKLLDKGTVIIGIANMQEFGTGTLGSNPHSTHLTARNPYNTQCYPGGSSSGSAVSVAAGFCPISIGGDGGGSVRIPAAVCGVVGLKPTFELIESTGFCPLSYSVGVAGPLCSSVLDAALALDVMTREGTKSPLALGGLLHQQLEGLNIGVYWEYFDHADREIVRECRAAVSRLEALGATIQPITIPELEECRVAHAVSISSEFSNSTLADTDPHFNDLCPETLLILTSGNQISAVDFLNAQKQRTRCIAILKHFFDSLKLDAIVTPATACVAPKILPEALSDGCSDLEHSFKLMRYSFLCNLAGIPGLAIPVGYSSQGLPIALQLMGTWHSESTLLKIGLALENTCSFSKPQVHYNVLEKKNQ